MNPVEIYPGADEAYCMAQILERRQCSHKPTQEAHGFFLCTQHYKLAVQGGLMSPKVKPQIVKTYEKLTERIAQPKPRIGRDISHLIDTRREIE